MLRCVIKGNLNQARRALNSRNIQAIDFHYSNGKETLADCSDELYSVLLGWFSEIIPQSPNGFPIGTLLFFRPIIP